MLRSLDAVVTQQGAKVGVFLTLEPPTSKMVDWAKQAGLFEAPGFVPVPRIEIVTVEEAIRLRKLAVNLPARYDDTFKKPKFISKTAKRLISFSPRSQKCDNGRAVRRVLAGSGHRRDQVAPGWSCSSRGSCACRRGRCVSGCAPAARARCAGWRRGPWPSAACA